MGREKMFAKTVKFNEKNYTLYRVYAPGWKWRNQAHREAKRLRKKGWNARVVHKKELDRSWYALYRRKK